MYATAEAEQRQAIEVTQQTIKQNKKVLLVLKQENKQLREKASKAAAGSRCAVLEGLEQRNYCCDNYAFGFLHRMPGSAMFSATWAFCSTW